jgi:hypothetical protein
MYTSTYPEPIVRVPLDRVYLGYNGIAYNKVRLLFPSYALLPLWGCHYMALGATRFYTFVYQIDGQER